MEIFKVHVIGCGSATPNLRHQCSTQLVNVRGKHFLIDCGEGTQKELLRYKIGHSRLHAIFISHAHGDHCLGLIGLLCTMGMTGRTAPLQIFVPKEFVDMLQRMIDFFASNMEYEMILRPVDTTRREVIYEDRSVTVSTIPLQHRVPCCGFLFREHPTLPHIRRDMMDFYRIPYSQVNNIKLGADWVTEEGETVPNNRLVTPADPPRAYAYCSDTRYMPQLWEDVQNVDLLYHESTYSEEKAANADKYFHSTGRQAATVARQAQAKRLLLGHFSASSDEQKILDEAQAVFPDAMLAREGLVVDV